ncbi:hypothetical protein ACWDA8_22635 [Streptomyces sp. NPDC001130]
MPKNSNNRHEVTDEDERYAARQARRDRWVGDYDNNPVLEELAAHERAADRMERLRQHWLED